MKTIFLSFSIANSSVTDYFLMACNKLSKRYRVVVITDKIEAHPFETSPDIIIYQWPTPRPTTFKTFLFLMAKIRQYRPTMMLSMFGSVNIFTIAGFLAGVKVRIAWVRSLSSQMAETPSKQKRKKSIYRLATHLFANSQSTSHDLQTVYGVPQKKITVLYNAVRKPDLPKMATDYRKLVFVGNLRPIKGLHVLLEAMPKVLAAFPEMRLEVIGGHLGAKALDEYRERATALGIAHAVTFLGWKQKQEIVALLRSASFSVVPSITEAFGFVVIESFSVGTPVIGSRTTGIAEIIRDGKDGLLFEPGNPESLAQKIIDLAGDNDLREACAAGCRERFAALFEIGNATEALVAEIDRLL